jgi:hypothetical protein
VRSASGDDGRKLFQHVGHRGPVYKGLGAMNPCDHLHLHLPDVYTIVTQSCIHTQDGEVDRKEYRG